MKSMTLLSGYIYLALAIITGIASNGFLKTFEAIPVIIAKARYIYPDSKVILFI